MSPERSVTYVSERKHKAMGNWALVTTVQNCPIQNTCASSRQHYFVKASMMLCGAMVGMILVSL
jgi:hypothetical protein